MKNQTGSGMKIIQNILAVILAGIFIFFVIGEMFLPEENHFDDGSCSIYEAQWVQVKPDGSEVSVEIPGNLETPKGEWVTIETVLPQEQEETWICIRSMQQELYIYVGEELRKEYSTLDTQLFGKTSTMTYVYFPLYDDDGGKPLRIEFMSDSPYAGYVSEMYEGDRADIERYFYGKYAPAAVVSALILLMGIMVVGCCIYVRFRYRIEVELLYLGVGIVLAATWLLVESKIRQFLLPNSTVAMWMGFLVIAIVPYPFIAYLNSIQRGRYQKACMVAGIATILNCFVTITLQVLNIKDFFEIMIFSHAVLIGTVLLIAVTTVMDIIKGYVREYREVAFGFVGFLLATVFEIGLAYVVDAELNGIALCFGLVLLLVGAGLKSIRDMLNVTREKQSAVAASESKAKFLANMSHEIRTPINTVIGMNEMILRENKDKTIDEYAHNIKSASKMLLSLVNDVLDFSKIEAGKLEIVEEDYHTASMIKDVLLGIEVRAKEKNLELKYEVDETIPSVLKGDEIRIRQILTNLLSNAIKYTEKGSVTLSVKGVREEQGFVLAASVSDTGIGIKPEDMEKLFASFQRLELNKNRYIEGTGLGLNIAKQLVGNMNGTIDVQSEYGSGSCFSVRIPQQIVDDTPMGKLEQSDRSEYVKPEEPKEVLKAPDARILAVDDTPMNLRVIRELLKRSGAKLDFATGGKECFEKTKQRKYDLILMDHMMPEPDGVQTLHMIHEDAENLNRETAIIVLTANAIAGMREQYLAEGFTDYLAKPVEAHKLEEMIAKYLPQRDGRSDANEP